MKAYQSRSIAIFLFMTSLAGCNLDDGTQSPSAETKTENIIASFEAKSTNEYLKVTYQLKNQNYDSVEISGSESIYANTDLNISRNFDSGLATFNDFQYDDSVDVSFTRANDAPPLKSTLNLPDRFDITFPEDKAIVTSNDTLQITWDNPNPGNDIHLEASSFCKLSADRVYRSGFSDINLDDDGEYTFINGLGHFYPVNSQPSCELTISLERIRIGSANEAFSEGSTFIGSRRSQIKLTIVAP